MSIFKNLFNTEARRAANALKAVDAAKAKLDSCKADLSEAQKLADTRGTHWERHSTKYKAGGMMVLCALVGAGAGYATKGKLATATPSKK